MNQMNLSQNNNNANNVYYTYPQPVCYSPIMTPVQAMPMQATMDTVMFPLPVPNVSTIDTAFLTQQCPVGYAPMIYDASTNLLHPVEPHYTTPVHYPMQSVEYMPSSTPSIAPSEPTDYTMSISQDYAMSVSQESQASQETQIEGEGEETQNAGVQKKYAFRSKQRKIDKVRGMIKDHFENLGLFAAEKELVRGEDTVRVHVKTFPGLTKIQEALKEIEDHPSIQITRIACPFSKKNKKQKKGFIVYLKVATVEQKEIVQSIFKQYEEWLKNCVTARPRPMPVPVDLDLPLKNNHSESLVLLPPVMVKVASGG